MGAALRWRLSSRKGKNLHLMPQDGELAFCASLSVPHPVCLMNYAFMHSVLFLLENRKGNKASIVSISNRRSLLSSLAQPFVSMKVSSFQKRRITFFGPQVLA